MNARSIFDISINSIDGSPNLLDSVRGKVCLFTNVATKAGYTPKCSPVWSYARAARQLWELQVLHEMFKDKGFSVVAFPCNQFGEMEPMSNEEISKFVREAYPFVTFPITEKIDVNGANAHPLYEFLKEAKPGLLGTEGIKWNFTKFLVNKNGEVVKRYAPTDKPEDIKKELAQYL